MKVWVFENADPTGDRFIGGFRPGHPLRLAWVVDDDRDGHADETDETICEELFALLNRDDRPNGKVAPSMSVGDVVTISDEDGTRSYTTEGVGFERLVYALVPVYGAEDRLAMDLDYARRMERIVRPDVDNEAVVA
jgi:hypothetical protein